MEKTPAISVIIPMFNAEKYVGECLECFLNQTFQDFEVVVVDDCSTDNSRTVVESYLEKFGDRLKIYANEKNFGSGATRNTGLLLARTEYIYFMDADDLLMLDGLEKMYAAARKFNAEVVNLQNHYMMTEDAKELVLMDEKNNLLFADNANEIFVDDNLAWRIEKITQRTFWGSACFRLFKRDFLIENKCFFPENVEYLEDVVWKHSFLFFARRIVHLSCPLYFYRRVKGSKTRTKREFAQYVYYRLSPIVDGLKWINDLMNRVDFIKENPHYRYKILEEFADDLFRRLLKQTQKRNWFAVAIYEAFKEKFGDKLGRHDVLVAKLCSLIDAQLKELTALEESPAINRGGNFVANILAVSVIIPMYNAEKYIGECLDSLLNQTFRDFEVIIVDDCSTDNGRAVVENYLEKFGGCLKIFSTEKNSGVAVARNKGLIFSRGEYVFFMDADDLLMQNGLAEMYTAAESFKADVVDCLQFYKMSDNGKEKVPVDYAISQIDGVNSFVEESVNSRVQALLEDKFCLHVWNKMLRRDFLIENELFFPEGIDYGENQIWSQGVLFRAKTILHLPKGYYLYRQSKNSITREKREPLQKINVLLNAVIEGLKWLDDVMKKTPLFQKEPQLRHKVLDHFTRRFYKAIFKHTLATPQWEIYESLKSEFGQNFGEYDVLIPALCTLANANQKKIEKLKEKLKA